MKSVTDTARFTKAIIARRAGDPQPVVCGQARALRGTLTATAAGGADLLVMTTVH